MGYFMKAVILAAGKGKRLRPLTYTRPKPLLPIAGKTILEHLFDALKSIGISEIILVVNYLEEKIKEYFRDGSDFGLTIHYVTQPEPKGTGDALLYAEKYLTPNESFIMCYSDLIVEGNDLKEIMIHHKKNNADVTLANIVVDDPSQYAAIEVYNNRITRIIEKPKPDETKSKLANAGIYVFTYPIFDAIKKTKPSPRNEIEITDSIQYLIDEGFNVVTVTLSGWWIDVGRLWHLLDANEVLMKRIKNEIKGHIEQGVTIKEPVHIAESAVIRSGSYIVGPVWIDENADIGPNNFIRPYTYIGKNVRIGNACEIKNSIILDNTHIAHLSYVGDSIIGENVNFGAGTITANLRLDDKSIKMIVEDKKIDSGHRKLGAFVGDNVKTGIGVLLMPGIKIGPNSWIGPGITVFEDVPSDTFVVTKGSLEYRPIKKNKTKNI